MPRCKNGFRKNRITGECEPKKNNANPVLVGKVKTIKSKEKMKRCPNGTRKNRVTGKCEPHVIVLPKEVTIEEEVALVPEVVPKKMKIKIKPIPRQMPPVPLQPVPLQQQQQPPIPEIIEKVPTESYSSNGVNEMSLQPQPQPQPQQQSESPNQDIFPESDDSENDLLYPLLDDNDFIHKISQYKEFAETQYDGEIKDIEQQADFMCNAKFEISPHQSFVRNFLSTQTPYNSLLLYHMLGSGKTCSAIGIAEEMRAYTKQMGISKKIIVVASPNVQQNFKKQLFDDRKLELINGKWFIDRTCIGSELLKEINPTNVAGLPRGHVIQQIQVLINQNYEFMGYIEFSNYMSRILKFANTNYADNLYEKKQYIRKYFDNQLVIIDEVHNINILDTANTNKQTAKNLIEIAQNSESLRLLFLSATPMYNSPTEIIWLVNLMNVNDKRPPIEPGQVFDKDGNFIPANADGATLGGREILRKKLIGYISFVRGENPYLFPFRVYPDVFAKDRALASLSKYPSFQMNQKEIREPLKHVPVYLNSVGNYQQNVYEYIVQSMGNNTKGSSERRMPDFENMESFGYTLLYSPLEALVMTYPSDQMTAIIESGAKGDIFTNSASLIKKVIGKGGLSQIVQYNEDLFNRHDFEYKESALKYGRIFNQEILPTYGAKIAHVCQKIRESTGIVLVYSQYIDGGIVPMALALEEMGFGRYSATSSHNRNLFKNSATKGISPVDWKTMKTAKEMGKGFDQQAKYVMITGDKKFSPNNAEDIKYVTNKENRDGKFVKVILISKAASEGVDFRNIRQIHILQPWYNMNRIEQTIGRGVRNQSHCDLPFAERNVEIYLHASTLPGKPDQEPADLYVYRMAERKAKQIGQVTRLLKENAVDCQLNIAQTNFTSDKLMQIMENQDISIHVSSAQLGQTIDNFPVGDRPYSDLCDYMDNCAFKCNVRQELLNTPQKEISTNYSEDFLKTNSEVIISRIRDLFRERAAFTREELISSINIVKKYPIHHIYYALSKMANVPTYELIDRYGRIGYLVNRGNTYAFQPAEILDESATMYERTVPVDFKHAKLRFEIPTQFQAMDQAIVPKPKEQSESTLSNNYAKIMADLDEQLSYMKIANAKISASEKNWFKHASLVVSILHNVHEIPIEEINKYAAYHYLDILNIEDKMNIVKHFYGIENQVPTNELEEYVKSYIDEHIFSKPDSKGILLASVKGIFCYEKIEGEGEWQFVPQNEFMLKPEKYFTQILQKYLKGEGSVFREIGFMDKFQEGDQTSMVFKIKTTKSANELANVNKGAKAENASKKDAIIPKLNAVWRNESYTDSPLKKFELCIILEILMRYLTDASEQTIYELFDDRKAGTVYFFGPESAKINQIWDK